MALAVGDSFFLDLGFTILPLNALNVAFEAAFADGGLSLLSNEITDVRSVSSTFLDVDTESGFCPLEDARDSPDGAVVEALGLSRPSPILLLLKAVSRQYLRYNCEAFGRFSRGIGLGYASTTEEEEDWDESTPDSALWLSTVLGRG